MDSFFSMNVTLKQTCIDIFHEEYEKITLHLSISIGNTYANELK